jgi:hypothetical protein
MVRKEPPDACRSDEMRGHLNMVIRMNLDEEIGLRRARAGVATVGSTVTGNLGIVLP